MFYKLTKALPTAICGLVLGLVSLSNLLFNMSWNILATVFFILSCIVLLLFIKKCLLYPRLVLDELTDRNICATFPAFTMALMTIIYIIYHHFKFEFVGMIWLWWITIVVQFIIIMGFVYYHIILHRKDKVIPNTSWFVTFVGIGVISETSGDFYPMFGKMIVYIATICFIILVAIVLINKTWRLYNENQFPMSIIIAAPAALCFNGYLLSETHIETIIAIFGFVISQLLFVVSLTFIPKLITINFRFSFSALTFPWVTTATAYFNFMHQVSMPKQLKALLYILMMFEILFTLLTVVYVVFGYFMFLRKRMIK